MSPEKKQKYREDVETVQSFTEEGKMNQAQIARFLRCSETKVANILKGKFPKWYKEELNGNLDSKKEGDSKAG